MKRFQVDVFQREKNDFRNVFKKNSFRYMLFPKDNAASMSIIQGWQYEKYLFDFLDVNHIDVEGREIIDIGANNGGFAIDFATLVGDTGRVHCFEPQRIIYNQLCGNIFLNGFTNVYCHNIALSNKAEVVLMSLPDYHSQDNVNFGDVGVSTNNEGVLESVDAKLLDSYEFKDVAFIKIDVQGYEKKVIEGAYNTIMKHRPFIFVEFEEHLLNKYDTSEEKLKWMLNQMNYSVFRFQEGIPFHTVSGKCLDCVCIPNEHNRQYIIP